MVTLHSTTLSIELVPVTEVSANSPTTLVAVIGSTTEALGESATIQGVPIAVSTDSGHTDVLVGSTVLTNPIVVPTSAGIATEYTLNGQTITQDSQSNYIVGGNTLAVGSVYTLTADFTIESVALETPDGHTVIVIGDITSTLKAPATTTTHELPLLTLGTKTYTPNSNSDYIIAGQTLQLESSPIAVSGTTISLIPQGTAIVIGASKTIAETEGIGGVIMSGFETSPESTGSAYTGRAGSTNGTAIVTFVSSGGGHAIPLLSIWIGTVVYLTILAFAFT